MTHSSVDHVDLHRKIGDFVSSHLGNVVSVSVGEDYNEDGDLFVTVLVAVRGSAAKYVRERPTGLLRALRAKLREEGVDAFPSLSFVSAANEAA